jgi:hypothetical protein
VPKAKFLKLDAQLLGKNLLTESVPSSFRSSTNFYHGKINILVFAGHPE